MNIKHKCSICSIVAMLLVVILIPSQTIIPRNTEESNPCSLPPGLPACDTPCVCKKILPPPQCGTTAYCPDLPWSSGALIYCSPGGCCVNVHFRYQTCNGVCQLSIEWLEYLPPGTECNSCQMVPYHFTSMKSLLSAIEMWLIVQPYAGMECFKQVQRFVSVRKPGCMMESMMPVDSCGNILSNNWGQVSNDSSCYSFIKPHLERVISACNNSCCVNRWVVSKDSNGATIVTLTPGYPKFYGVECSPRINPPPPGVDSLTWLQSNPPQYDPSAECKNTCGCKIPLNTTPPYQYNNDCFPSQFKP